MFTTKTQRAGCMRVIGAFPWLTCQSVQRHSCVVEKRLQRRYSSLPILMISVMHEIAIGPQSAQRPRGMKEPMNLPHTGGCQCGKVRYEITEKLRRAHRSSQIALAGRLWLTLF